MVQTHESTSYCFHGFIAGVSSQTEALLNSVAESHRPKQNIVPPDVEVFCQTVGEFFLQLKLTPAHTAWGIQHKDDVSNSRAFLNWNKYVTC